MLRQHLASRAFQQCFFAPRMSSQAPSSQKRRFLNGLMPQKFPKDSLGIKTVKNSIACGSFSMYFCCCYCVCSFTCWCCLRHLFSVSYPRTTVPSWYPGPPHLFLFNLLPLSVTKSCSACVPVHNCLNFGPSHMTSQLRKLLNCFFMVEFPLPLYVLFLQ